MATARALIVAAAGLAAVTPAPALAEREEVFAIVGAKVVTVSGPVLEPGTVILRGGLIDAVGASLPMPAGARVIDGRGLTVTPGLIDGFGGIGLPAAGSRTAATPGPPSSGEGGGSSDSLNPLAPQALVLERIRAADALKERDDGITTALVVPREGVLPGRSVLINLSGDSAEAMAVREPAALHVHMATLARRYPNSLMGTVALVRQALLDAARYREQWSAYEKAPAGKRRPVYDAALEAWSDVVAGKLPLVVTARRENDIRRALAIADEFNVRVVVADARQAWRVADLIKARGAPLLVSVNFDPPKPVAVFEAEDEERDAKEIQEAERNPAELYQAGVAFALVSGHAPKFLAGVRKAIERGLPAEAALRALTLGAAEALGIADRTGSLDKGKMANLVAWSGQPLTKEAKVKMVFVDGLLYEPEERSEPASASSPAAMPEAQR